MKKTNLRVIGSTDAANAITGNIIEVVAKKRGLLPEFEGNVATRLGLALEEHVVSETCRHITDSFPGADIKVLPGGVYQHPVLDYSTSSPDRFIHVSHAQWPHKDDELAVLELKTTAARNADEWHRRVPERPFIQVQDQMEVVGPEAQYSIVACLTFEPKLVWRIVERSPDVAAMCNEVKAEIWSHIEQETMPVPGTGERNMDTLKLLYPMAEAEQFIELPSDALELISAYSQAADMAKDYTQQKEAAKTALCALIGKHAGGVCEDYKVGWSNASKDSVSTKLLKEKYPEVYADIYKRTNYRIFRIGRNK